MRKRSMVFAVMVTVLFLTSGACTKSAPSCSDVRVKKLVLDKVTNMSKDIIASRLTPTRVGLLQIDGAYDTVKYTMSKESGARQDELRKVLSIVDDKISKTSVELTDIQVKIKDRKSRACGCSASLVMTNKETNKQNTSPFEYTARFADDGALSVQFSKF